MTTKPVTLNNFVSNTNLTDGNPPPNTEEFLQGQHPEKQDLPSQNFPVNYQQTDLNDYFNTFADQIGVQINT